MPFRVQHPQGMPEMKVNADNFARAETHRMMADLQRDAGGVNRFFHNREPAAIDKQTVIRLNRDTLYSFAVVDISSGAVLTVPDAGDRYLSVMIVNEDHYINRVFHDAGSYDLTAEEFGSPYVVVAARTLVDPREPEDLVAVAVVQDQLSIRAASERPFNCRTTRPGASTAPATPCWPWLQSRGRSSTASAGRRTSTRCTI